MIEQSDYDEEARERMTKRQAKLIRMSDIEPLTDREKVMIENAYRRGFFQGFCSCFEAAQEGFRWQAMERFLYERLFKWRYSRHGGKFQQPPWIAREARKKKVPVA
jgi:hypothetical protein